MVWGTTVEEPRLTIAGVNAVLKGALVKLQLDHIDTKDTNGMLNNVQPGFDGTLNAISASFDFMF